MRCEGNTVLATEGEHPAMSDPWHFASEHGPGNARTVGGASSTAESLSLEGILEAFRKFSVEHIEKMPSTPPHI